MPSPNCSVLSPQTNRVPGQRDVRSHSSTERQFSLLPACPSFLSESRPAFPSLGAGVALQCTNTPACPQHAVGEKLELAVPEPQKISSAPETLGEQYCPQGRVLMVDQTRAPIAEVGQ